MSHNWEVQHSVLEYCDERWPETRVVRIWLRELIHTSNDWEQHPKSTAQVEFSDGSQTELELDGSSVVGVARSFR